MNPLGSRGKLRPDSGGSAAESPLSNHLSIALGASFYGLITVGGKYFADLGFSLYEIAFLIMALALFLLPALCWRPQWRLRLSDWRFFSVFGLIGALLQLGQFAGLVLGLPVAVVAFLLYSQPIFTILLGRLILRETITAPKLIAAGMALAGVAVLFRPWQSLDSESWIGLLAALSSGLWLALWVVWGRRSGLRKRHQVTTAFGYGLSTGVWLLVLHPLAATWIVQPRLIRLDPSVYLDAWVAVAIYTVLAGVAPACLVFGGMRGVEASTGGILMLFEPLSAALVAWVIFGQALGPLLWLGAGLILAANLLLTWRSGP